LLSGTFPLLVSVPDNASNAVVAALAARSVHAAPAPEDVGAALAGREAADRELADGSSSPSSASISDGPASKRKEVPMEWPIVALVLLSALLHATWNALTKAASDPLLGMAVVSASGALAAAAAVLFLPLPEPAAWPFIAASTAVHVVYQLVLVRGYTLGDLSQVYPIARGLAPLGVAALAAWTAGEVPSLRQTLGLALASGAIASIGWRGRGASGQAVATAAATAALIATYTTIDGLGVRRAGSPWSYSAWVLSLYAVPIVAITMYLRLGRLLEFARGEGRRTIVGGVLAVVGYAIVLFAMSRGAMAAVASLRETSVVFAALIGVRMLGEPFGAHRIMATLALALGLVLVQV
jgi:drug/metabolite transporter (DMT)-like permease